MEHTIQIGDMAARLMLARLNISQWSARKLDRSATSKTTNEAGAKADAARVNKFLLSGNDTGLKAIGAIATAARADYYALTAPWTDNGDRVLTADAWKELNGKLSAHSLTYAAAVDDFIRTDYTDARERARSALGALFDAADFPAPYIVRQKFGFDFSFDSLPTASDFRVTLADDDAEMIRQDIERRTSRRMADAVASVWQRLHDSVQHVADTMARMESGEQKRLFDSVLANVRDIAQVLPALNLTRDPQMDAIAARVLSELGPVQTETLRDDPTARQRTRVKATSILAAMAAQMAPAAVWTPEELAEDAAMPPLPDARPEPVQMPADFVAPQPCPPMPLFDLFAPSVRA